MADLRALSETLAPHLSKGASAELCRRHGITLLEDHLGTPLTKRQIYALAREGRAEDLLHRVSPGRQIDWLLDVLVDTGDANALRGLSYRTHLLSNDQALELYNWAVRTHSKLNQQMIHRLEPQVLLSDLSIAFAVFQDVKASLETHHNTVKTILEQVYLLDPETSITATLLYDKGLFAPLYATVLDQGREAVEQLLTLAEPVVSGAKIGRTILDMIRTRSHLDAYQFELLQRFWSYVYDAEFSSRAAPLLTASFHEIRAKALVSLHSVDADILVPFLDWIGGHLASNATGLALHAEHLDALSTLPPERRFDLVRRCLTFSELEHLADLAPGWYDELSYQQRLEFTPLVFLPRGLTDEQAIKLIPFLASSCALDALVESDDPEHVLQEVLRAPLCDFVKRSSEGTLFTDEATTAIAVFATRSRSQKWHRAITSLLPSFQSCISRGGLVPVIAARIEEATGGDPAATADAVEFLARSTVPFAKALKAWSKTYH